MEPGGRIDHGAPFDQELPQMEADAKVGLIDYAENPDQAPGIFREVIEGRLGMAPQNLTLRIGPAPGRKVSSTGAHLGNSVTRTGSSSISAGVPSLI